MKASFVRKTRRAEPAGRWTERVARRVRDWLDRYLAAKEMHSGAPGADAPPASANAESPGVTARESHDALFRFGGEPPAHWLERVRVGAPQLLLSPEEGGTPWVAARQTSMFSVGPAALPAQDAQGSKAASAGAELAADSEWSRQRQAKPARDAEEAKPHKEAKLAGSEETHANRFVATRRDAASTALPTANLQKTDSGDESLTLKPEAAFRAAKARDQNQARASDAYADTRSAISRPAGESAKPSAERKGPVVPSPAEEPARGSTTWRSTPATNDREFVPPSPAELWPEVFARAAQPSASRFGNRGGGTPQAAALPEFPRMAAGLSSDATRAMWRSAAEHRFPQVPLTAVARPVPDPSRQGVGVGESWPEDLRNLWPELPSAPEQALMESERAMRQWERDLRLDREQRGEF